MGSGNQQQHVRHMVGARLQRMRNQRNLRQETAAQTIGVSIARISRMEHGLAPFHRHELADLLTLYGVTDPAQREVLISVAVGERSPAWWDDHDVPLEDTVLWSHEQAADLIRTYAPLLIPDLLQTEEYARAIQVARHYPAPPSEATETHVKWILRRQQERTARLWAVIHEAALRNPVAGNLDIHRRQLDALAAAGSAPDVVIQILPARSPFLPSSAPFTIFRLPGKPVVLSVHHHTGDEFTELAAADRYGVLWDQLIGVARHGADTPHLAARVRDYFRSPPSGGLL